MKNLILIFISLFIFSCDSDNNPISVSNEIDVDWVLVKTSNFNENNIELSCDSSSNEYPNGDGEYTIGDGTVVDCDPSFQEFTNIGYFFYFTNSSNLVHNIIQQEYSYYPEDTYTLNVEDQESFHILSINYKNETMTYDLSDSFNGGESFYEGQSDCFPPDCGSYNINFSDQPIQRIIYNEEMGYVTLFGPNGFYGTGLNVLSPNELVDYR